MLRIEYAWGFEADEKTLELKYWEREGSFFNLQLKQQKKTQIAGKGWNLPAVPTLTLLRTWPCISSWVLVSNKILDQCFSKYAL